uniref:Seroin transcript 1A2 n=1 Tax=Phymatopus californicus TaxID=1407613 RepID=A0A455LAN3_9NEOP|nr:seroin transcript 1A2 [Phymatopus californicus]
MGGFSVIVFAACLLVSNVGVSSGFGFPHPVNAFQQARDIQSFVHNQIRSMTPFAGGVPVPVGPGVHVFNGPNGAGVVSAAGAGGGVVSTGTGGGTVVSTSTGGGTGGFVSTLGGGGGHYGGGSTFVSSGGPKGGFGVIQTSSNIDGKQSGQVLINENGKVTAYELPPGGGTVFTVQSNKGGPGVASSSYSSSYSNGDGEKSSEGGVIDDN